ncbi:MAG: VOC family protein [Polyangiales bacterium]
MRFLQFVLSGPSNGPPSPEHMATIGKAIDAQIASGQLIATGGVGKRATAAARVVKRAGKVSLEDPPSGTSDSWMSADGFSLVDCASKEEAIAGARAVAETLHEGVVELIQVSELHPPPKATHPAGVVPYLTLENASEAAAFYSKAFAATELARMFAEDGKRIMHCHLSVNGGALMIADYFPEFQGPVQRSASYTMQLIVRDGDTWWNRAIAAGCKEILPFAVAPWGDKYGQLKDPFGVTWAINSPAAAAK